MTMIRVIVFCVIVIDTAVAAVRDDGNIYDDGFGGQHVK